MHTCTQMHMQTHACTCAHTRTWSCTQPGFTCLGLTQTQPGSPWRVSYSPPFPSSHFLSHLPPLGPSLPTTESGRPAGAPCSKQLLRLRAPSPGVSSLFHLASSSCPPGAAPPPMPPWQPWSSIPHNPQPHHHCIHLGPFPCPSPLSPQPPRKKVPRPEDRGGVSLSLPPAHPPPDSWLP